MRNGKEVKNIYREKCGKRAKVRNERGMKNMNNVSKASASYQLISPPHKHMKGEAALWGPGEGDAGHFEKTNESGIRLGSKLHPVTLRKPGLHARDYPVCVSGAFSKLFSFCSTSYSSFFMYLHFIFLYLFFSYFLDFFHHCFLPSSPSPPLPHPSEHYLSLYV